MKKKLITVASYFVIGLFIGAGMSVGRYLIPLPDSKILVCFDNGDDGISISEQCHTLSDLRDKRVMP